MDLDTLRSEVLDLLEAIADYDLDRDHEIAEMMKNVDWTLQNTQQW